MRKAASAAFVTTLVALAAFVLNNQVHAPRYTGDTPKPRTEAARQVKWPPMALSTTGYTGAGAGTAADNGIFSPAGNDNSAHAYFTLPNGRTLGFIGQGSQFSPSNYVWTISNTTTKPTSGSASNTATDYYVIGTSDPTNFPLTGWVAVTGTAPPPSFTVTPVQAPTATPVITAQAVSSSSPGTNTIGWGTVPNGVTQINLYKGPSAGGESATAQVITIASYPNNVYSDSGNTPGATVFYKASWGNSGGNGPQSAEVSAASANYSTQSVAKGSSSNVMNASGAPLQSTTKVGFYTYNTTGSDPGQASAIFTAFGSADANGFTLTSPSASSVIYALGTGAAPVAGSTYAVRYTNNGFVVSGNNLVAVTAQIVAPTVAPVLSAQSGQGGNTISFNVPPAGATVLYLYRGSAAGQEGTGAIAYSYPTQGQAGNIVDTGANNGQTQFYTAVWGNSAGNGPASNEVQATATPGTSVGVVSGYSNIVAGTPNTALLPPTQLNIAVGDTTAILNWIAPPSGSAIGVVYRQTVNSGPVNPWILAQKLPATTAGNPLTLPTSTTLTGLTDGTAYEFATFTYA